MKNRADHSITILLFCSTLLWILLKIDVKISLITSKYGYLNTHFAVVSLFVLQDLASSAGEEKKEVN